MNTSTIRLFLDSEAYHMLSEEAVHNDDAMAVSYTHLTLPTILLV